MAKTSWQLPFYFGIVIGLSLSMLVFFVVVDSRQDRGNQQVCIGRGNEGELDQWSAAENEAKDFEAREESLSKRSGRWESRSPKCTAVLDYRRIEFGSDNEWIDLNNRVFLLGLGTTKDFITRKAHYLIEFEDNDLNVLWISRISSEDDSKPTVIKLHRVEG